MESYFWVGEVLDNFLFKGLNTKSWQGILGVCAALTAVALVYEAIHVLKLFFLNRFISARKARRRESNDLSNTDPATSGSQPSSSSSRPFLHRRSHVANENGSGEPAPRSLLEESDNHNGDSTSVPRRKSSSWDFLELGISSALHGVYMFLGFTIMNAVMTFNLWVLIAVLIGSALGYFVLGNYRIADNLMHPLGTETTSLNDDVSPSSTPPPPPPPFDGGGDRCPDFTSNPNRSPSRTPKYDHSGRNEECEDPGESSKLIVGAEVHTPRILLSTSTTST